MKCPKCSLPNPETQRFCGDCGTRLVLEEGADVSRTTTLKLPSMPLLIGTTFADRYQIIEELGKGGMGRVYRALDKKLDEEIAVKFIRPELAEDPGTVERFRTELKAARQVIHKNVARMFDLNEEEGVSYITMEYVRGENLKSLIKKVGRLDAKQAVPIAKQVAEGLSEAHRTGVIHRDLKPHNIMIDEEGVARITDFGLASLKKPEDATLTGPGMGTPAYASPEQVEGAAIDGRSDLYSLGIVLYEMLTGEMPFQGDSPYSVALKRLTEAPPDPRGIQPEIPEVLVQVIMRCLRKDLEKRYQTAGELAFDLEELEKEFLTGIIPRPKAGPAWFRVRKRILARRIPLAILAVVILAIIGYIVFLPPSPWKVSIAVLPVMDMSPQEDRTNLSYGLQSDISEKLNSIPELKVIAIPSHSVNDYSGKNYDEIGKELGADYLMQLTLQTEGTKLRVRLALIEARSSSVENLSYERSYERELKEIYLVQDEISRYTATALQVKLVEERLSSYKKRETANLEAYNCYWEGFRLIEEVYHNMHRPEDFDRAVRMYKRAIELDPEYALAYWGLGNAYEARYYEVKDPEDLRMMREYYLQAHSIDPNFAETHLGLGWVYFNMANDANASFSFKRAFTLDPDKFIVNYDVGAFLRSEGLYDKAIKYFSRAAEIDPNSVYARIMISSSLMCLGEFEKAIVEVKKAIAQDPDNLEARYYCASELILLNRLDEAEKEIEVARKIDPKGRTMIFPEALLWAARGEKEKALELMSGKDTMNMNAACIYILLGMKEEAINCIEESIKYAFEKQGQYLFSYPSLSKNPILKRLRGEPRFEPIVQRQKAKYEGKLKNFAKF